MKIKLTQLIAGCLLATAVAVPTVAPAQSLKDLDKLIGHRQSKKNEWRNIAIGSGAVGLLGLLRHDNTLVFVGAAGALYSLNRYEQDRKSQSKLNRSRAAMFSRTSFKRNGHTYQRRLVTKNGKKYYQFVKVS